MDERQSQIKEGAGLDESRLNTDFIEFINKWGPRLLLVFIVVMGLYLGRNYFKDQKIKRVSDAFRDYNDVHLAGTPPNMLIRDIGFDGDAAPESLLEIARQHRKIQGVATLAEMRAADAAMAVVRRGVELGAILTPQGDVEDDEDLLTDDRRTQLLDQAASLYQSVFDAIGDDDAKALIAIEAAFGLAAVAEGRGDLDTARSWYAKAGDRAGTRNYPKLVELAAKRTEDLPELANPIVLLSEGDLFVPPLPVIPDPEPIIVPPEDLEVGPAPAIDDPTDEDPATVLPEPAIEEPPVEIEPDPEPAADPDPADDPVDDPATDPPAEPPAEPTAEPDPEPTTDPAGDPPATDPDPPADPPGGP